MLSKRIAFSFGTSVQIGKRTKRLDHNFPKEKNGKGRIFPACKALSLKYQPNATDLLGMALC